MAFLNFNGATQAVRMDVPGLVAFASTSTGSGAFQTWETQGGHELDLFGSGFTFDVGGRPTGGRANSAQIDVADDGLNDVQIGGINLDPSAIDDSAAAFWSTVLSGTTVINAQGLSKDTVPFGQSSFLFGDDLLATTTASAAAVTDRGGNDVITIGTGEAIAVGDVDRVEGVLGAAPRFAVYEAGNDQILAQATDRDHDLFGDAFTVGPNARLIGGDDLLQFSGNETSEIAGDVFTADGSIADRSVVEGGKDWIEAKAGNLGEMVGDVFDVNNSVDIVGGNDTITGAEQGEVIAGDVRQDRSTGGASIAGGADAIDGGGGDDTIAGDVLSDSGSGFVAGGNDTIRGGDGADVIFGDIGRAAFSAVLTGGNDQLFGDAGDDGLHGQTGNDRLDGGTGADSLDGGAGLDVAAYGSGASGVTADLLAARLNRGDAAGDSYAGIEGLLGSGFGDVLRGDNAANQVGGGGGTDALAGRGGADRLDGGAANDRLLGGLGNDTFVFAENGDVDRVLEFENGRDRLDLGAFDFCTFGEVSALAANTAAGLRIDFGGGDVLVLTGFTKAEFTAGDVLL